MSTLTIGVIGNPNCGRSTLFNCLTGAKQQVGNWPGVTVDRKTGSYQDSGQTIEVIDTPGIYSLAASSLDEQVTRDFLLSREANLVVNIVDASNIERNLYLTTQLLEMGVSLVVALNMMDMAAERKLEIDVRGLAERLGCPVIPLTAAQNKGIKELKAAIRDAAVGVHQATAEIFYPAPVQEARELLAGEIQDICAVRNIDCRWLALKLLEGDDQAAHYVAANQTLTARIADLQKQIEHQEEEEVDIVIASAATGLSPGSPAMWSKNGARPTPP